MSDSKIAQFFRFDDAAERGSADNPQSALGAAQRRPGGPLQALAFGWGFSITGLDRRRVGCRIAVMA